MEHPPFSLAGSIGITPLVELRHLNPNPRVRILAKLEGNNVGGSVKDRPALYMLAKAEESGELVPEKTILEPTSGNTGIALAMLGTVKGYRVKLVMPACVSLERRAVLEAYGAELVLSPHDEATDGAIRLAHRILEEEPDRYYMPNQYANPNNPLAHYETTAPEIFRDTGGAVDFFVAGMGTGGTLMGTSRYFREKKPSVRIVGVEPRLGHKVQGLKNMQEAIVPPIYHPEALDLKLTVHDEPAFDTARELAAREGLFVGMSSGAAVAGAVQVARDAPAGSTIVVLLPDRGDRYLSTVLFRSVCGKCPP
ncbi:MULTISPECIES: PLP-dependent cysteine synthase family protein [Geobacter]|uniref:cysteine synthase n=2 Tax=Geobacter TaxID=28231 RepID=A0A0C1U745_9BACT|nr:MULTISPECIES: cysteine synthase family protein [Geobacter]BET59530.1 cysteine synthase family protein [Geobacter sp. 60473]KIE43475.1 cysteine synthase [Geobacter soli]MBE2888742.1 cysteine synthase family protein [Geobacter anodireducens]BBA71554.1 Cysteine synthase B [Geobacter sulfurreducens]BEH11675.1 cysteine synthase family protein [Geobacter sulfurreducens subsp. ethanolicus]